MKGGILKFYAYVGKPAGVPGAAFFSGEMEAPWTNISKNWQMWNRGCAFMPDDPVEVDKLHSGTESSPYPYFRMNRKPGIIRHCEKLPT